MVSVKRMIVYRDVVPVSNEILPRDDRSGRFYRYRSNNDPVSFLLEQNAADGRTFSDHILCIRMLAAQHVSFFRRQTTIDDCFFLGPESGMICSLVYQAKNVLAS